MKSLIIRTTAPFLVVLLAMFSLYMLARGHNLPGGGFIGGLMISAALALDSLPHGTVGVRRLLRADPRTILATGLLITVGSGAVGLLAGDSFLTGVWLPINFSVLGQPGTPLFFDIGVYLVVVGAVQLILLTLGEE